MSTTTTPQPSDDQAPNVQVPAAPPSNLGAILGNTTPQAPLNAGDSANGIASHDDDQIPNQRGSRLASVLGTIAKVAAAGFAGIPDKGAPSFFTGLGEGARAQQAQAANSQAAQNAIKFKTFDDSVRAANLHNQDLQIQGRQQEQDDAHQKQQDFQHDWEEAHGITHDVIPNTGSAVTDHLTAQTSANGAASIPAGTHLGAGGDTVHIPTDTQQTKDGQLQQYKTFGAIMGLPSLPQSAQFVPPKQLDMLMHKMQGYDISGENITADKLPGAIASTQTQRDYLASNGGTPDQLKQLDHTLDIYKANLKADSDAADTAAQRKTDQQTQVIDQKAKDQQATNAAKPQKAVDTDWKPGVTSNQKTKTGLAENMVLNANSVASILIKRPDIVGSVAGRFTSAEQMMGNNDPDIAALGTAIHNIAMANNGIHGMKSHEGVADFERLTLNNFKNGPQAIAGALNESAKSVQTFIDEARPNTYKTHTSQGGAKVGMLQQAGQ